MLTELRNRLSYLLRRGRFDDELDAELQFHVETRADELQATGLDRKAAVAQARREFGSGARAQEETRSAWQFRRLEDLASDLRYAARGFARNPAFAATAIACLALAIGANTTIFSLTTEVLFAQPSVRDAGALVAVRVGHSSHAELPAWRFLRDSALFDGIAGENEESETNWRRGDVTERLHAVRVTDNFFEVTGIPVAIGRPPVRGERDTVVLSYGLWQRRFNGDPAAIGAGMLLDGQPYSVTGVLPRDHRTVTGFGFSPDLYVPVVSETTRVALFARLPRHMPRADVYPRLRDTLRQLDPKLAEGIEVTPISGMERVTSGKLMAVAAFFGMLMTVAGLVLLIACANVASMLLARASSRSQEIAIRLSIGAGRGRLVRQLLAESFLLAVCGTAAGLLLNIALTRMLSQIRLPLPVPVQYQIEPDWRLLAYSAALAVATCLTAGLVPAFRATGASITPQARQVARGSKLRNALVGVQVAVSVVLLCAGLLFLRNLVLASTTSPGFDVEHTVWGRLTPMPGAKTGNLADEGLARLRAMPGVDSAALVHVVPFNDNITNGTEMRTDRGDSIHVQFRTNYVGPDYFRVMQIPIVAGREFLKQDRDAAIINEALARRLFPGADPIGHTITWDAGTIVVVGVAKNSKYFSLGEHDQPAYYAPWVPNRGGRNAVNFMVRAAARPEPLVPAVTRVLGELDRTAAVEVKPMSKALVFAMLPSQVGAAVLGAVGLLGLALAAIGLYGALLYSVSRRLPEIGLRMALGASPTSVLRLVVRQSAGLAGAGAAIGLVIAVFAVRPLAFFLLPEVSPTDPSTFAIVAVTLFLVSIAATVGPALRALRVDPVVALRHE
jgi:predicted permease